MTISIDRESLALQRRIGKVRDPALVFVSELPRTGDTRHPKHYGRDPEGTCVVMDILVGGAFGATIGRIEVQRLRLGNTTAAKLGSKMTVNFIGRGEQNERPVSTPARRFENVERASSVHFEISAGIIERRGDGNLSSEMIDLARRIHGFGDSICVTNVGNGYLEPTSAFS